MDKDTSESTPDILASSSSHEDLVQETHDTSVHLQLSLQALDGTSSLQSLRFHGTIWRNLMMVLMDTGSFHNIMQPRLAKHLQLPISPIKTFPVMIGDGSHLICNGQWTNVPLLVQNHLFTLPFYLLPIQGADLVLGMERLRTLGPIISDFVVPCTTFTYNDCSITLKGELLNPQFTTFQ